MKILLIGQGIAGSVLGWHLMKAGYAVTIADDNHTSSSSLISAGIVNPITGQRLALVPEFDLYLKHATQTYAEISIELRENFFEPKPIVRVLRSDEERARAWELSDTTAAKHYVAAINPAGHFGDSLVDPFGTLVIAQGGFLRTRALLTGLRQYFSEKQMLINDHVDTNDLKVTAEGVQWKSQTFDTAIFCEGFQARENPWFKDRPYNFAKGEILRITFGGARNGRDHSLPDAILCQQQWCLPLGDGTHLAGSTYDREHIDMKPTLDGERTILEGLRDFIPALPRVINRWAAVRPVMLDMQPLAHMHPTYKRVGIFNGFASKGILWAPYFAETFVKQLISQVGIGRDHSPP